MLALALLAIAFIFAFIGSAIARARGYGAALGWTAGWIGPPAWLVLALLPERKAPGNPTSEVRPANSSEERFPRIERSLHVIYPLVVGLYVGGFGLIALSAAVWPPIAAWLESPAAEFVLGVPAVAMVALLAVIWMLSIYLLIKDERLPRESRGHWAVALIVLNMLAGLIFVPWRWRVLRRQRKAAALQLPLA